MRRLFVIALFTLFVGLHAQARLGDTEAQLEARYGAGVKGESPDPRHPGVKVPMVVFFKDKYIVAVVLIDGKATAIGISKADGTVMTDGDVELFLNEDGPGQKWTKQSGTPPLGQWLRDDGAKAELGKLGKSLGIRLPPAH